jgi:hypothetical protein
MRQQFSVKYTEIASSHALLAMTRYENFFVIASTFTLLSVNSAKQSQIVAVSPRIAEDEAIWEQVKPAF